MLKFSNVALPVLTCLCLALSTPALAKKEGGETGGGGGNIALEMQKGALEAWEQIRANLANYPELQNVDLAPTIQNANILEVEFAVYAEKDGITQESVAVNYPEKNQILVSRSRWLQINDEAIRKALALHEFLSLLLVESTGNYSISSRYLGQDASKLDQALYTQLKTYEFELQRLQLIYNKTDVNDPGLRSFCTEQSRFIAEKMNGAQKALGLPHGILKQRALIRPFFDRDFYGTECTIKFYSFDPNVRFLSDGTKIRTFQGKEGSKTACLSDLEEINKYENVVWSRLRVSFTLLQGHFCNVQYVVAVKTSK